MNGQMAKGSRSERGKGVRTHSRKKAKHAAMKCASSCSDTSDPAVFKMLSRMTLHVAMLHVISVPCRHPPLFDHAAKQS